jgi:hypothetical protein
MVAYSCETCYKTFDKKSNYKAHLARKIKCEPPSDTDDSDNDNIITINPHNTSQPENNSSQSLTIPHKIYNDSIILKEIIDDTTCSYCNKKFTRRDNVNRHIEKYCEKAKEYRAQKIYSKKDDEKE